MKSMKKIFFLPFIIIIFSLSFVVAEASGNSISDAETIKFNSTYYGSVENHEHYFYKINLTISGELFIDSTANFSEYDLRLYDSTGSLIKYCIGGWNSITEQYKLYDYIQLTSGTYYICITDNPYRYQDQADYNFKIKFTSSKESFIESQNVNNDTIANADTIRINTEYRGQIALNDTKDFYKFSLADKCKIEINVEADFEECEVYLYDSDGNKLWGDYLPWNNTTEKARRTVSLDLKKGNYSLCVTKNRMRDSHGNYIFKISGKYPVSKPTSIKAVPTSTSSIKLSWNPVSGVTGYVVYKYTESDKKYTKIESTSVNNYTVKDLKPGTNYKFAIKAYKKISGVNYYSGYSSLVSTSTKCSAPTSIKATPVSTSEIKLTWGKVTGATGYSIYKYSSSDKKYTKIATVSSNSYNIKELKAGTKYKYAVKAYKKISGTNYYSAYSSIISTSTKCSAPTVTVTSSKSKTATISWKKVTGASKYIVYKSTDNKKWTKVGETTKLTYDLTKLTGGKKIYVKVVSVNAYKVNSAYCKVVNVTVKK